MQRITNWEKVGVYFAVMVGFLSCIFYIADMKERIAKLEVKMEISTEFVKQINTKIDDFHKELQKKDEKQK